MDSFRLWSRGIVVSVIVTVVIEIILPENNSKKYIKIVFGIFIVYSIIAPVFELVSDSSIDNIVDEGESIIEASSANIKCYGNNDEIEANKESSIRNIYSQSLQSEINKVLLNNGYIPDKIDIEIADDGTYSINKINVKIKEKKTDEKLNKNRQAQSLVQTVKQIVIDIDKRSKKDSEDIINESDKSKIKKALHDNFGVNDNCTFIT